MDTAIVSLVHDAWQTENIVQLKDSCFALSNPECWLLMFVVDGNFGEGTEGVTCCTGWEAPNFNSLLRRFYMNSLSAGQKTSHIGGRC